MENEAQLAWQVARQHELASPDSWLGLVGLFWLAPGVNRVGSTGECAVCLPGGPEYLGDLLWQGDTLIWQPVGGEASRLASDRDGLPTTVDHENLSFFVVDRDGRLAARVRDRAWAERQPFAGLDYFPFAPEWRIEAAWQPLSPGLHMAVPNVTGDLQTVEVKHQAVFDYQGERVCLLPMAVGEHEVFFVFRDRTSGKESYGAGRFLKAAAPRNGRIQLDFNRAFNPPCAFTPFATCPLPPPENWLAFAVTAGEKSWRKP